MKSLFYWSILLTGLAFNAAACSFHEQRQGSSEQLSIATTPVPSPIENSASSIRSVDLARVRYADHPDYSDYRVKKRKTLEPGQGAPHHVSYGDVTGDGVEEAMAVVAIPNRGSATPDYVYVFTLKEHRVELLWGFETGDRADGGLRRVYAESGNLVIELYGADRYVGGQLYLGDEGLCCPTKFTRSRYVWRHNRFELVIKQTLDNPSRAAGIEM